MRRTVTSLALSVDGMREELARVTTSVNARLAELELKGVTIGQPIQLTGEAARELIMQQASLAMHGQTAPPSVLFPGELDKALLEDLHQQMQTLGTQFDNLNTAVIALEKEHVLTVKQGMESPTDKNVNTLANAINDINRRMRLVDEWMKEDDARLLIYEEKLTAWEGKVNLLWTQVGGEPDGNIAPMPVDQNQLNQMETRLREIERIAPTFINAANLAACQQRIEHNQKQAGLDFDALRTIVYRLEEKVSPEPENTETREGINEAFDNWVTSRGLTSQEVKQLVSDALMRYFND